MEAKSQEYAAYRFHRKARLMNRMMFFYNIGQSNYVVAGFYSFFWTFEIAATDYHRKRLEQMNWWNQVGGRHDKR